MLYCTLSPVPFQGVEAPMVLVNIDLDVEKVSVQPGLNFFSRFVCCKIICLVCESGCPLSE